jgi:hypothetical protein
MNKRKLVLSMAADAKTIKGMKQGFYTGILYLAPASQGGRGNVCSLAKLAGCEKPCLYNAGRGAFSNVQQARINKTRRFFDERDAFMADIVYSIESLIRKANRLGLTPLVRLNGTSDIAWENIPVTTADGVTYESIFDVFPSLNFYDYTKLPTRKNLPANYDLTFSYSGVATFAPILAKARLNASLSRIAVVFDKAENIPAEFLGLPVIAGDNSDVRHTEPQGVIVALYAKGAAKRDLSGFVVRS